MFYTSKGRLSLFAAFVLCGGAAGVRAETTATVSATTATITTPAVAPTSSTVAEARSTTAPLLQRVRMNYDEIAPDQDATRETLEQASTLSKNAIRSKWLLSVARAEDFRETSSPQFTDYKDLKTTVSGRDKHLLFPTPQDKIAAPPTGVLNGKLMFVGGGHGWTNDNTSTSLWYTQRPSTHGIVEDLGNLDQMSIFADMCFRAGATVIPMRPVGFQHVERVIDNDSPRAFFQGAWADSQSTTSFGFAGANVPYRFSRASAVETAVARFVPVIPEADNYPVYAWARDGADRVTQTYRINHAGGISEVDIDHRRVGKGWIYLGQYNFEAGQSGYVEVTNKVRNADNLTSESVVIADAIRFGNGIGDVNRGGGISGYPREEEASKYWIQRSVPEDLPPFYNASPENGDQSNNVGAAPRMVAYMNRETEGNYFDRVYISFHSNAVGGRGVMGLYNAHAIMRPDHQIELAKVTAEEINSEMNSAGLTLPKPWTTRRMKTQAHINFGEIRRDYISNEMSATILETAFHDNKDDAELMRKLSIREAMARATFRAALRYFKEVGKNTLPIIAPPDRPVLVSLTQDETTGNLKLKWKPATLDPLSEAGNTLRYKVYQSKDGFAFDTGTEAGTYTDWTDKHIPANENRFYRVTAINEAGESLPSQVFGSALTSSTKHLLFVHGTDLPKDDTAVTKTVSANLGAATRGGGSFVRIIQRLMDSDKEAPTAINAAAKAGYFVETISASSLTTEAINSKKYQVILWDNGRSAIADNTASTNTLNALDEYIASNGKLIIGGAALNRLDSPTTDSIKRWANFTEKNLDVKTDKETTVTGMLKMDGEKPTTKSLSLRNRALRYFDPRPTLALTPGKNSQSFIAYEKFGNPVQTAAVAHKDKKGINTITVGFPLSEIKNRQDSEIIIGQMLELVNPTPKVENKIVKPSIKKETKPAAKKQAASKSKARRGKK